MIWKAGWRMVLVGEHILAGVMSDKTNNKGERKEQNKRKNTKIRNILQNKEEGKHDEVNKIILIRGLIFHRSTSIIHI